LRREASTIAIRFAKPLSLGQHFLDAQAVATYVTLPSDLSPRELRPEQRIMLSLPSESIISGLSSIIAH